MGDSLPAWCADVRDGWSPGRLRLAYMASASTLAAGTIESPSLAERARAAYLGLAVGDALGATVEFMTPREIRAEHGVHDTIRGGGWLRLRSGQVTDDTTMALALGEAILAKGPFDGAAIAEAFDRWMRTKPVDIGNTVRRGILHYRRTGEVCVPENEFDGGNGAAMRVLPTAIATFGMAPEAVTRAVLAQARTTHNNALSDAGTLCVTEMLHLAFAGRDRLALLHGPVRRLIDTHPAFDFRRRRTENPSGFIGHTLCVVFEALFDTDGLEDALVLAVNRGGDADTTGAIVGMLAGAVYGPAALPRRWLDALDTEVRVKCEEQAGALVAMVVR